MSKVTCMWVWKRGIEGVDGLGDVTFVRWVWMWLTLFFSSYHYLPIIIESHWIDLFNHSFIQSFNHLSIINRKQTLKLVSSVCRIVLQSLMFLLENPTLKQSMKMKYCPRHRLKWSCSEWLIMDHLNTFMVGIRMKDERWKMKDERWKMKDERWRCCS